MTEQEARALAEKIVDDGIFTYEMVANEVHKAVPREERKPRLRAIDRLVTLLTEAHHD